MEDKTRSFEPVHIGMTNVETGRDRFNHISSRAPSVAFWRVNLTALSQKYNLYFVATADKVQVYRPDFPFQLLGNNLVLTIIPQLDNPSAEGYINTDEPHNLNHLIVGDLGNEEILLLATDSGNVVAYHTRAINAAVKKDVYKFSADGNADFVGVRPFFTQWVYESAWGLAIHSKGRMIAVSANVPHYVEDFDLTSKVTVFAFALTQTERGNEDSKSETKGDAKPFDDASEWQLWSPSSKPNATDIPRRDCNYKIILGGPDGHPNNIPCITFVNNPEDDAGSWLLSTDISGVMKMWQIWKGRCFKTWKFANVNETTTPWTHQREAGWLVAALDINAFRPAHTMDAFIGHQRARQYYGYHSSGDSYELSDIVQRFTPNSSTVHPYLQDSDDDSSEEERDELNEDSLDFEGEIEEQHSSEGSASLTEPALFSSHSGRVQNEQTAETLLQPSAEYLLDISDEDEDSSNQFNMIEMDAELTGEPIDDDEEEEEEDTSPNVMEDDNSPASFVSTTSLSSYNAQNSDYQETPNDEEEPLLEGSVTPSLSPPSILRKRRAESTSTLDQSISEPRLRIPQIPIIHCSTSHVRLFSGPKAEYPHIFCARMLRQTLPPPMEQSNLALLDRLDLIHQIPELGIVLIATQLGRCAVCSLTRRTRDGLLGFRVDWILPTKRQEREGIRPLHQVLLGIAASPIQGRAIPKHVPISEHDVEQDWARDRVVSGVPTTFDPEVVVLRPTGENEIESEMSTRQNSLPVRCGVEKRQWTKPYQSEKWRPHENSRRFRLMLTYTDMTVLTYELSRGVEKEDVRLNIAEEAQILG